MNIDNRKRKSVKLKYLFSVMTIAVMAILFSNFFTILTNPGDFTPSDLLVKSASAEDYGLEETVGETSLPKKTVSGLTGRIIGAALSLVGVIFLALMIYGGILWMTAKGNEEQITKARNIIIAATIGLIIVLSAYAITNFVLKGLT